jgi:tetratricopeptide (TPR) repeat protein
VLLLLSLTARADIPDWSVVPLDALLPDPAEGDDEPLIRAAVSRLTVAVTPGAESRLTLTYELQAFADGLSVVALGAGPLTVGSALLDGRPVAVPPEHDGQRLLVTGLTRGSHTVVLAGVMLTPRSTLSLPMPEAPVEVLFDGAGLDVAVERGAALSAGRLVVPPGPELSLSWKPAAPPAPRPDRLEAVAAVGLTLSTDGIEGSGVVTFDAIRGAVDRVRIAVPGADWAEATGTVVASSALVGEWLEVSLIEPQTGRFTVEVGLRGPAGSELSPAPLLVPQADSREGWVSIYQGEEGYLARQSTDLTLVSPDSVPDWGQSLASGQLLSSLHYTTGHPALRWRQSEWESLQTPGTVIDSARYEVAVVAHGRALTRARLQVRNDRGAWLWMDLPRDSTVLAVRVAGHIVEPVTSEGRLGIPLEKSVETLTGLVSFPVEVAFLSPSPAFSRRGRVRLSVPAVSAPVADAAWTLYLPPGTTPRHAEGNVQPAVVAERELLIGRGYRQVVPDMEPPTGGDAVSDDAEEVSQEYWNQAYDAYKSNRFDEAGELLEQSLLYNPDNMAASALQDNVVVLTGEVAHDEEEVEQVERVKAMARAKSQGDTRRQSTLMSDAESQLRAGNVEEAIELYESAIEVSDQLARLESDEAYVQKAVVADLRERLAEAQETSSRNRRQQEAERREFKADEAAEETRSSFSSRSASSSTPSSGMLIDELTVEEEPEPEADERFVVISRDIIILEPDPHDQTAIDFDGVDFESIEVSGSLISPAAAEVPVEPRMYTESVTVAGRGGRGQPLRDLVTASRGEADRGPPPPPAPEPPPMVTPTTPLLQSIPAGRSYQSSVELAAGSSTIDLGIVGGEVYDAPVQTVSAFDIPTGVTASRWIVLVPESGPVLRFSRQLVPADEPLEVVVPYRMDSSGRQGG